MGKAAGTQPESPAGVLAVFLAFLHLGCTAFGGPVAHRARFREMMVASDTEVADSRAGVVQIRARLFEDLWVFANLLPGPSSSQVAMAIGRIHAGTGGALAAWLGFSLPTTVLAIAGGYLLLAHRQSLPPGLVAGLMIAVFVVILNAVRSMLLDQQRQLRPLLASLGLRQRETATGRAAALGRYLRVDGPQAGFTVLATAVMVLALQAHPALLAAAFRLAEVLGVEFGRTPDQLLRLCQLGLILLGLAAGALLLPAEAPSPGTPAATPLPRTAAPTATVWLLLFALLLATAVAAGGGPGEGSPLGELAARFYRVGALVFGGGHVVLPLLEAETVPTGLVERETFLAGYGAIQALPGPLFAFAGFLGTVAGPEQPAGWLGGLVAVAAIFAPSLLLVSGLLDLFLHHRDHIRVRRALRGANAAVVGILAAALWPIWTAASGKWHALGLGPVSFLLVSLALLVLLIGIPLSGRVWRLPAPAVVLAAALAGWALAG